MSPRFIHPYVGTLEEDRFAKAQILNDDGSEAMVGISAEAQSLFEGRLDLIGAPRSRDICLSGQMEQIQALDKQTRKATVDNKIDLFELVQGIWQLARQGLCRAHEENTDRPRVPLNAEHMFYPIPHRTTAINNKLSKRVFRYRNR